MRKKILVTVLSIALLGAVAESVPSITNTGDPVQGGFIEGTDALLHYRSGTLFLYRPSTGVNHNLGVVGSPAHGSAMDGGFISFVVPESAAGVGDLNGDGDATDQIWHVYDLAAGTASSTGLASAGYGMYAQGGVHLAFIDEGDQSADLNGDGDTTDVVPHLYLAASNTTRSLGFAVFGTDPFSIGQEIQFNEDYVVFTAEETENNQLLNVDADMDDDVLHVHDIAANTTTNIGPHAILGTRAGPAKRQVELVGHLASFGVDESFQGDMNMDGDRADIIVFLLDAQAAISVNLLVSTPFYTVAITAPEGTQFAYAVDEAYSAADINGDGDQLDTLLQLFDYATGVKTTTTHSVLPAVLESNRIIGVLSERIDGAIHNGDADALDVVLVHYDIATDVVTNTGIAVGSDWLIPNVDAARPFAVDAPHYVFKASEWDHGTDLNGDGILLDDVLHRLDLGTGAVANLGSASVSGVMAHGGLAAFAVRESFGNDLNGDGDTSDRVMHVANLDTAAVHNTMLAVPFYVPFVVRGGSVYFTVDEFYQNQDLDLDGLLTAEVFHIVTR